MVVRGERPSTIGDDRAGGTGESDTTRRRRLDTGREEPGDRTEPGPSAEWTV